MTTLPSLPAGANTHAGYSLAVICLGNICRSPMAGVVLAAKAADAGLDHVRITSGGTGDWHVGQRMDARAAATLTAAGYDATRHRGQQFDAHWFDAHDAILVMDDGNRDDVLALARGDADRAKVRMFRAFDPEAESDLALPDPYFGGNDGFERVMTIVERTSDSLIEQLRRVA